MSPCYGLFLTPSGAHSFWIRPINSHKNRLKCFITFQRGAICPNVQNQTFTYINTADVVAERLPLMWLYWGAKFIITPHMTVTNFVQDSHHVWAAVMDWCFRQRTGREGEPSSFLSLLHYTPYNKVKHDSCICLISSLHWYFCVYITGNLFELTSKTFGSFLLQEFKVSPRI